MKPNLLFAIALLMMPCIVYSQGKKTFDPNETISADSAKRSIIELLNELAKKHPGFYRYTSKPAFDKYIDSSLSTINGPQNQLSYYRKLKPVIAHIRCVHTGLSLSEPYAGYLDKDNNLLPLEICFIEDKAYITHNYSGNTAVPVGAEILSINGKPMPEIKKLLFDAIPSDGYNETFKYQLLNNRFAQWYRSVYEINNKFTITVITASGPTELLLTAVKNEAIPIPAVMDLKNKPRLDLQIKDSAAVLTIKSFAETDLKAGGQNFKKLIAHGFEDLKSRQVKYLIIDLRNNTGGTDANAAYLCSYLMNKLYRYWDRIEVTEPFALSIKGAVKLMYGKPLKRDSIYLWQKSKFTREFDFYEPQQPQANAYTGKIYVLINGACLSSCADLAAVLKYNKRAVFIGEETGGGYQGNNSGLIPKTKITFGLNADIPLLKYLNAVDMTKNKGHGTFPDITYNRNIKDIIDGKDPEMDIAMKLVTGKQ